MSTPSNLLIETKPWLDWLRANGRAESTIGNYQRALAITVRFWTESAGPRAVHEITPRDLDSWAAEMKRRNYAPVTCDRFLRPWKLALSWMEERGIIFSNPAKTLLLPEPPRKMMPVPSERDVARLLDSIDGTDAFALRDRAMLEVIYATGMRRGELVALQIKDLDLDGGVVAVVGKGGKERVLPLTATAAKALRRYLDCGRPLLVKDRPAETALWLRLCAGRGKPIQRGAVERLFWQRSRAVGMRISAHDLRRAFATHLLRRGLGVNELRLLLGHTGFRHMRHYVRYAAVDLQRTHRRSKLSR